MLLFLLSCLSVRAQTSTTEFLPEVDANFNLNPDVRLVLQAKGTREGGDPNQREFGPSVEFYLKPLFNLQDIAALEIDPSKSRTLVLAVGYRYLLTQNKPSTNRTEPVAICHFPMKGRVLISDKNRADLDWSNGAFTWRYRNRLEFERRLTIHAYHPGP